MQEKKNINLKKFHKREIQSNYLVIKSEQKFDFIYLHVNYLASKKLKKCTPLLISQYISVVINFNREVGIP